MVFCHLENAIFHFLKKHYTIGAYFPYSFIKIHFYNETTGNIRKALANLKKYKIVESIGKGEYKFIKDEFQYPSDSKYVKTIELQNKKIDQWLIDLIIQTIKKFNKMYDDLYPSKESIYLYLKTNSSKEKVFKHIEYMIDNFIVIKDEHGKIIPYHIYKQNLNLLKEKSKKSSNKDIDINIEIRKIYGYITKKNKELKTEIEKSIQNSLYSVGKEIGEFQGRSFAKLMIEINNIDKKFNYQNQQKDEKIRSLNDKIKTLRKDINSLIHEVKSLKCRNNKKE